MKALWVGLLLLCVGCSSADRVTEEDRQLSWQTFQASALAEQKLIQVVPAMSDPMIGAMIQTALQAAKDSRANTETQVKNWGEPKVKVDYSPEASAAARGSSTKSHESSPWIPILVGGATLLLGWFTRSTGLGAIPLVGKLLQRFMPTVANGAAANEKVTFGLQLALDKVRVKLDALKAEHPTLPIPSGDDVERIVMKTLNDLGALKANTLLYDHNKLIPDEEEKPVG